ncbi:hypothetical protein BSKO_12067 [Bryopsis sp. KO-2023]|nr:hypothetical protein BSKO_12067 [Bryopsis sp. KO-2023]
MSRLTSLSGAPLTGGPRRKSGDAGSSIPSLGGLPSTGPSLLPKPGAKPTVASSDFGAIDSLFDGPSVKKKVGKSKPSPREQRPPVQNPEPRQAGFGDFPVSRGLLKNPLGRGKPRTIPKKDPVASKIPAKKAPELDIEESDNDSYDNESFGSEIVAVAPAHPSPTRGAPTQQDPTTPFREKKDVQQRERESEAQNLEDEEDPSVSRLLTYFQDGDEDSKTAGNAKSTSPGQGLNLQLFGPGTSRPSSGGMGRRAGRSDQTTAQSDSELQGEQRGGPPSEKLNWSVDALEAEDIEGNEFSVGSDPLRDKGLTKPSDNNIAGRRAARPNTPDPLMLARGNNAESPNTHLNSKGHEGQAQKPLDRKVDNLGIKKPDDFDFDWELDLGLLPEGPSRPSPTKEAPKRTSRNEKPTGMAKDFVVVDDDLEMSSMSDSQSDDGGNEAGGYVPSFLSPPSTALSPQPQTKEAKSMLKNSGGAGGSQILMPGAPRKRNAVINSKETLGKEENKISVKDGPKSTKPETGFKMDRSNRVSKLPLMEDKAPEISEASTAEGESTVSKGQMLTSPLIHNKNFGEKEQQSSESNPRGEISTSIPRLPSSSQESQATAKPTHVINTSVSPNGGPTLPPQKSAEKITGEAVDVVGENQFAGSSEIPELDLQCSKRSSTIGFAHEPLPSQELGPKVRKEGTCPFREVHATTGAVGMDEDVPGKDAGPIPGKSVPPVTGVQLCSQRDFNVVEASLLATAQNTWKEIEALASSAVAREKEVSIFLKGELPERGKKLDLREKLVMDRERALEKRERGLDALKTQIIELLEKIEKTASQDRDEVQGERARLAREHSRLDAFYKTLEDDRADVRQQLELERKLVENAREERRQERRTMLGEMDAERRRLAEEQGKAVNALRALQQEEMDTRRRISELDAMATMAQRAANEEEGRLNSIKDDLESRKQSIESSREEMQKEAQTLSEESERVSEALGFVDVKMQELRDLTQDVPNMMLELNEGQKKLQEEWMQCAAQQESLENERRALAMEKESVARQRDELELRHQQICLEREALNSAAAEARLAKQKLSETVQLMSSEGLTTQVLWDSTECKLSIQGNQAKSPRRNNAVPAQHGCDGVEEGFDQILSSHGGGPRKYGSSNQAKRTRRSGGRNRNSQNSLRKMLGHAGVDLKQLEQEAKKSNVHLSSQIAFLQQAQSADGFHHFSSVNKSACAMASNLSVQLREIDLLRHQKYLTSTQPPPIQPMNSILPSGVANTVNSILNPGGDQPGPPPRVSSKAGADTLTPPCFIPLLNPGSTTDSFEEVEPEGL